MQEASTTLSPSEVIKEAKTFFGRRNGVYSAFLETEGPSHVTFRGQGGEEIVVAGVAMNGVTRVTASTYLFDQQVARFLSGLPEAVGIAGSDVTDVAAASAAT